MIHDFDNDNENDNLTLMIMIAIVFMIMIISSPIDLEVHYENYYYTIEGVQFKVS